MHQTIPDLVFSDELATCWPTIRGIWCETNAQSLGLAFEGPIVDLMQMQFSAKTTQYQSQYLNLQQRIAHTQNTPFAYILWSLERDELVVVDIAVLPAYQKNGIATTLLQLCMKTANQNNKPVRLTVTQNNPAVSLYKDLGFTIVSSNDVHHQMLFDLPIADY